MIDNIIFLITIVMTGLALMTFVYSEILFERPLPDNDIEFSKMEEQEGAGMIKENFKIKKLIINLQSHSNRLRFLELTAHLVPFKNSHIEIFERNSSFLNDTFIDVASKIPPNELNSVSGKILLEDRIKKKANKKFGTAVLKDIYFSRFVIQ